MKNTTIKYNSLNNNNNISVLPDELNSILIGTLLSDGGLYRSSPTANVRFEMSLGENSKEFAFHMADLLKEFMNNPVKSIEIKGVNKVYTNYRLNTKTLSVFNQYYEMFYKFNLEKNKFVKIVPENIIDLMNPIVLAYLIQGDGNFDKGRNRVRIYTNSFTKLEVQNLAEAIKTRLNIYTGVLHDRKDQWILTIGANNLEVLRKIVLPYFHPTMYYRLGL